ncbi:MAG: S8 family peptidase, partial [Opitutaceae bacterium]
MSLCLVLTLFVLAGILRASQTPPKIPADRAPLTAKEIADGYRGGEIIVKPRTGVSPDSLDTAEAGEGYALLKKLSSLSGMRVLEIPAGVSVQDAISHLQSTGRYEFAELNRIHRVKATPNDTYFSQQWSLKNTGSTGGKSGADIKAVSGWDIQHDASSVIVAVIDTGIRLTHPDLSSNLWTNTGEIAGNGIDDDHNGYIDDVHGINATVSAYTAAGGSPSDDNGHGTHLAGIIGASGNNGVGISGVAWRVQIMPLKAAGADGRSTVSDELECIQYAIDHHASIINASYGQEVTGSGFSQAEYYAMQSAQHAGIIVVAAAGNSSANIDLFRDYPACYALDNVIAVGSSADLDDASLFSNYGSGTCELFAPGESILSLYNGADTGTNAYAILSGTSMAAPHVVGVLALLKARFPSDAYRQLINRLLRGVDPIAALADKAQTGGRLSLYGALSTTDNRPFNDDFASRAHLQGANVSVRSSNQWGSVETGEPQHAGIASYASLWWDWTAPTNGQVTLDSSGGAFDAGVAVYTGDTLSTLTPVAGAYDTTTSNHTGRLSFAALAGTSYR